VITYVMANPDVLKKGKRPDAPAADGAGIHDLIAAGKVEEAVEVYAAFNGVDQFTARAAVLERVAAMTGDDQTST
jgi:hypothetical protein